MSIHRHPQPSRLWTTCGTGGIAKWQEVVQPGTLCVHLNFHGEAKLAQADGSVIHLAPQSLHWVRGSLKARRLATNDRHECLTLVFPDAWLATALDDNTATEDLHPVLQRLLLPPFPIGATCTRALTESDRRWAAGLMAPHLCEQARRLLETSRLTDFLVQEAFTGPVSIPAASTMSRTERMARERVERAKAEFLKHLDNPPSLEDAATLAGCSPHYLSRTFTQVEGLPLVLWLRRVRIDHAAKLLSTGECNVSEAALEVGYRSLSHFSRAFAEEKGVTPSKWAAHLSSQNNPSHLSQ